MERSTFTKTTQGTNKMGYNSWKNKETWLVNIWYMAEMPQYFADIDQYEVQPNELKETIIALAEVREVGYLNESGLIADLLNTCWAEVDWCSLAEHLNETLSELEEVAS